LGENAAAEILDMTLKEEGQADHLMTSIAERINVHAKHAHTTAA
jgi:ferritin-like metal-binding protein YciE